MLVVKCGQTDCRRTQLTFALFLADDPIRTAAAIVSSTRAAASAAARTRFCGSNYRYGNQLIFR